MNENVIWGIIYILTFVVVFACSVIFTLKFPAGLKNATKVKWSESVGLCYTDIPYGDGELNKFDLYVPADSSKESYGLVVYIHAGGFRGGDKKDSKANLTICSCDQKYYSNIVCSRHSRQVGTD
jgi:acetyl esterase/lipase